MLWIVNNLLISTSMSEVIWVFKYDYSGRKRREMAGCLPSRREGHLRIVVRDGIRAKYFVVPGTWEEDVNQAHNFDKTTCAIDAALQMHRDGLEVVLLLGNPAYDVTLPIGPLTDRKWAEAS